LDFCGEAFGMGMVERWKEIGGRKRGSFRRDGSESEREREQAGNMLRKVHLVLG